MTSPPPGTRPWRILHLGPEGDARSCTATLLAVAPVVHVAVEIQHHRCTRGQTPGGPVSTAGQRLPWSTWYRCTAAQLIQVHLGRVVHVVNTLLRRSSYYYYSVPNSTAPWSSLFCCSPCCGGPTVIRYRCTCGQTLVAQLVQWGEDTVVQLVQVYRGPVNESVYRGPILKCIFLINYKPCSGGPTLGVRPWLPS